MTMSLMLSLVGCGNKKEDNAPASTDTDSTPAATEAPATDDSAAATEAPTDASSDDAAAEEDSAYTVLKDENGNPYDLGGMEIIVRDWWSPEEPAAPTTAAEEATLEYHQWLQDTYNFKLKQMAISDWGSVPEDFINYATTGGDENYVFIMRDGSIAAPMGSGLFYDLSTLDCLDFTEEKWEEKTKDLMSKNGGIFGMRPEHGEIRGGMYFNKRLLEEAGVDPESIYDMQKEKTWTWSAFEDLCNKLARDTDNDGVTDVYAMVTNTACFFDEAVASNLSCYIKKNDDGTYANNIKDDAFLEAYNWAQDMFKKYQEPQPEGSSWDWTYGSFQNAEGAIMADQAYKAGQLTEMEDDFGFVCFPMGPKADRYMNVYSDNISVIPACYDAEKAWKIAFAYNLWTNPTPGYDPEETWKDGYYTTMKDTRSVDETLTILRSAENSTTWYQSIINGINTGDIMYTVADQSKTVAENVDAVWDQWNAYIDEFNKK